MLPHLTALVISLQATNSSNEKKRILGEYAESLGPKREAFLKLLATIYDPYQKFNVTAKRCLKKDVQTVVPAYGTLQGLLDALVARQITGNKAIAEVVSFCEYFVRRADVNSIQTFWNVIDKDLKCRIDVKLINDVFPDLIPTFDVALAKPYDEHVKKVTFGDGMWMASRKLDGIRTICVVEGPEKKVTFYSREGHEFTTLAKVAEELRQVHATDYVLDGEMCLRTPQGEDDFRGILKQIRKKNHTIDNPHYLVFDHLTLDEFRSGKGETEFYSRVCRLGQWRNCHCDPVKVEFKRFQYVSLVEQCLLYSAERFEELREQARREGWEGLMLRKSVGYEGKRTANLLKVKDFKDAEFVVERIEPGVIGYCKPVPTGNVVDFQPPDGGPSYELPETVMREVKEEMLGKAIILFKGNEVGVGSGFTIEERQQYHAHPEEIVGKTITVQYFEETKDERGNPSLRFPTFKALYEGKRDV